MDVRLTELRPEGRAAAEWLVAYARAMGLSVYVTSGYRTPKEQAALTPAAGLYKAKNSLHTQRRAFDLGIHGYRWQDVPMDYWRWLGSIWKQLGGRWGGDFSRPDPIHFDF